MTGKPDNDRLREAIDRQVERKRRSWRERDTLLAQTAFLGTLGLLFVLPVLLLAYLGVWLDGLAPDYSARWTVGLILFGLCVGAFNVWLYVREHP